MTYLLTLVEYRPGYPSKGVPPGGAMTTDGLVLHYPPQWGRPGVTQLGLWGAA